LAAVGVSFTLVPELNVALQMDGQLMPAGLLVTVPVALPASWTVKVYVVAGAEPEGSTGADWASTPVAERLTAIRITARTRAR
jgi:hypothetical protein